MSTSLAIRNPNPQDIGGEFPNDGITNPPVDFDRTELTPEGLLARAVADYRIDRDHWQRSREEIAEMFDLVAGNQWSEEDLQILADQLRPALTFNRIGPLVDAVEGMEINNRQETRYEPRQLGAAAVDDVLTGAAQWVRQLCDAEDEETQAFMDMIICGIGCVQTRMDYENNYDGDIVMERVNPLEMYPDAGSKKQNFADGRRVTRMKDVPIQEARDMFPDANDLDLDAQWARDEPDQTRTPHNARLAPFYKVDQAGDIDRDSLLVRLVEKEWWQYEEAWRVLDPESGRFVMLSTKDARRWALACRLSGTRPYMKKDRRRKYWKAIFGAKLLKLMDGNEKGAFSYKFMTGKRDRTKGVWYGVVRAMKDPQIWGNKWVSQGLHILNTNAKGGLWAETDAFDDIDAARDSIAEADSIVELNPGGLAKIQPKVPPPFPQALSQMTEMSISILPMTSGINQEMIGQSTSQQPQVALLEEGRRQQGMNVLAGLFNAKRRYQKEQGRLLLWMIQHYITDERLVRIGGPEEAQWVPLIHQPGLAEYEIIVDDGPTSTNMKERAWAAIMQLMPMLRTLPNAQALLPVALKYAPVPVSLASDIKQAMSQPMPPNPATQGKNALDQARAQSEGARSMVHQATAGKIQAETAKITAETKNLPARLGLDIREQQAKIEKMRADAANQLQNAGITSDDARFQSVMQAIDALLQTHGSMLDEQDQEHQHAMDLLGHGLAARQQTMAEQQPAQGAGA